jgi:hypothetical protein
MVRSQSRHRSVFGRLFNGFHDLVFGLGGLRSHDRDSTSSTTMWIVQWQGHGLNSRPSSIRVTVGCQGENGLEWRHPCIPSTVSQPTVDGSPTKGSSTVPPRC